MLGLDIAYLGTKFDTLASAVRPAYSRDMVGVHQNLNGDLTRPFRHLGFFGIEILNCRYGVQGKYVSPCHNYFAPVGQTVVEKWPFFHFSRWRPYAILYFQKFEILTGSTLRSSQYASPCQTSCRTVKLLPGNGRFSIFFSIAAVQQLGFLKLGNFKCLYGLEVQCAVAGQISRQLVKPLPRFGPIFHF